MFRPHFIKWYHHTDTYKSILTCLSILRYNSLEKPQTFIECCFPHSLNHFTISVAIRWKSCLLTVRWRYRYSEYSLEEKKIHITRRRHQMGTFYSSLVLCEGNSPVTGEFPSQRPVTRRFDVFFDLCLNKRLKNQSILQWFEPPVCPLWRRCNEDRNASMLTASCSLEAATFDTLTNFL